MGQQKAAGIKGSQAEAEWPEDGSTVLFEDLVEPVCAAIRFAYRLNRRNLETDIPWTGLDIGRDDAACSPTAARIFLAENLAYVKEDQGRDALCEIVSHAIRLGIEQGRRIAKSDTAYKTLKLQAEVGQLLLEREQPLKGVSA